MDNQENDTQEILMLRFQIHSWKWIWNRRRLLHRKCYCETSSRLQR